MSSCIMLLGSLSRDDDNGGEDVTRKVNSRCFKLNLSFNLLALISDITSSRLLPQYWGSKPLEVNVWNSGYYQMMAIFPGVDFLCSRSP